MSYRKECQKVYKKLNTIAQKGTDGIYEYYSYIDELIDNSQYSLLEDVMITKYNINISSYKSTYDLKHKTFDLIRGNATSSFQVNLKKLFDRRNVYPIGFHFYDKVNNYYLGDIREIEEKADWIAYKDPKLAEKQDQKTVINLEVVVGLSQSILESIPQFENDTTNTILFATASLVIYSGNIYGCSQSYIYGISNPITPTYSNYWRRIYSPTYSYNMIDNDIDLMDKYDQAITLVKSFGYRIA
jgi:hypothetical protein